MTDDEIELLLAVVRTPERARTSLEERIALLEDHRQLHDLVLTYGWLCDARRWDVTFRLHMGLWRWKHVAKPESNAQLRLDRRLHGAADRPRRRGTHGECEPRRHGQSAAIRNRLLKHHYR